MKQCYPKNEFRLSDLNLIFLTWIIVNVTKSSLSSDTDLEDAPWCLVKIWWQKKEKIQMQKLIWFWRKWNVNTADNSCNHKASSKPVSYLKVNFSPSMSPKLFRTYLHIVENRRITIAPSFLRLISWKSPPHSI